MGQQIIVFSDTHYSRSWDRIDQCLRQHPHHTENYLNPNRELKNFIEVMNRSFEVDTVINNGDSIDYHFSDFTLLPGLVRHRQNWGRISNRDLFNHAINRLNKHYIAIPGNHDYRKEAYNYAIWGTDQINLSRAVLKKYRHQIGHQVFRGPWELASIMVNENKFDPLNNDRFITKREDRVIAGYHCIFLNTGSDAFVRPANFIKYLKKIATTRKISYDSDGLMQDDLNYLSRVLSGNAHRNILIFQHVPLINSEKSIIGKEYQLSVDRFDDLTQKQKISCHTILNGGAGLLKRLRDTDKNIVLVSSHIHHAKYFLIDKKTLAAREVSNREFNNKKNTARFIKQITTLPLGSINSKYGGNKTGFLKISQKGFEEQVSHVFL